MAEPRLRVLPLYGLKSWTCYVLPTQNILWYPFKQLKIPCSSQDFLFLLDLNILAIRVNCLRSPTKQLQPPHSLFPDHSVWAGTLSRVLCSPFPAAQTLGCSHPAPKPCPLGAPLRIFFPEPLWGSRPSAQGTASPSSLKVNIYFGGLLLLWRN